MEKGEAMDLVNRADGSPPWSTALRSEPSPGGRAEEQAVKRRQTVGNGGTQGCGTAVSAELCQRDAMSARLRLAKQGKSCDAKVWGLPVLIRMAARPPDTLHPLICKERKKI